MTLLVTARDGAGNVMRDPVETLPWVRDNQPPTTVARLASPLFTIEAVGVLVTNSSVVSLALESEDDLLQGFVVTVARLGVQPPANRSELVNITGGDVNVSVPWDGSVSVSVVRVSASRGCTCVVCGSQLRLLRVCRRVHSARSALPTYIYRAVRRSKQ